MQILNSVMHQRFLEQKPFFALAIPSSLLIQWHKVLSEQNSQLQEVEQVPLLEVPIRGSILHFTDNKAKRHEINKHLAKIDGSETTLYRKTKGIEKQQLENKVKNSMFMKVI